MGLRRLFSRKKAVPKTGSPPVGYVVKSVSGRDKGRFYIVTDQPETLFVTVADGKYRSVNAPKRKNLRHLLLTEHRLPDEYIVRGKVSITDGIAADFIRAISEMPDS